MKNFFTLRFIIVALLLAIWAPQLVTAQVTLGTSPYVQSFDGVGSGLPTGWTTRSTATAGTLGTSVTPSTTATAWNNTTGQFFNGASADGLIGTSSGSAQNASTDRALCLRQTASYANPGGAFVLQLANTTGKTGFQASFKLQSLDQGSARTTTWKVEYGTGATPTSFTPVNTLPATLTTGGSTFTNQSVTVDFGSALNNNSGPVWIRVVALAPSTGSGNRATTGLDDFSLSWSAGGPFLSSSVLSAFNARCINAGPYGPNSFTITGSDLTTDDVTVDALSGYTYSTNAIGPYTSSLTLSQSGGEYSQAIYVQFDPTAVQSYSGNIPVGGGGATTINVAASGSGVNTPPSITTGTASTITSASATVAGTLNATTSCGTVTAYGIEYSTNSGFTPGTGTAIPSTNLSGTDFSSELTGLSPCTNYYTRAYATRSTGTTYGAEGAFTTSAIATPVATTGTDLLGDGFTANWNAVDGATGYFLDVSTSPTFGTSEPGSSTTETFTDMPVESPDSYNTRTWTGEDGVGWTAYKSRTDQVVFTGNKAVTLQNEAGAYLISDAIAGGVSAISFDVKQNFNGSGGILTVKVLSGAGFATSTTVGTIAYTSTESVFNEVFTAITGPVRIRVENNAAARPAIDNLSFTRADVIIPSFVPGYDNLSVGNNLLHAVTGLDPLTTYYYRVRSEGGCSTGVNSNVITVTTGAGESAVLIAGVLADHGMLCVNTSSIPQSVTLSGYNLTTADVTVAALAGFSYSTTELGTYTSTLSIPQGGGTYSQDIWVKFNPEAELNYNGDIIIGGGGAADINLAAQGIGIATPSEISTGAASQSGDDQTVAYGSIDVEGCFPTTAYGIEYSTTLGFTPGTGTQVAATDQVDGTFSSILTGLELCTDYYYRAYLTNSQGSIYGTEGTFNNTVISAPAATAATGVLVDGFTANWDAIGAATGYFLDVSTSPTFGSPSSSETFFSGFDSGRENLPTGWSHTGLGNNYTSDGGISTPSLRFDNTADVLLSATFAGAATSLSFWYKGQSTDGSASSLLTEGFNGTSWVTIGTLGSIASSATGTQTYSLDHNDGFVQFRFTYTKVTGNLAFDDVNITYTIGSPDLLPGYDALPVVGTSQEVTGLDPATTYYYRVRANSGCSVSANSDTIPVTTLDAVVTPTVYYSRANGTVSDPIWSETPTGTIGVAVWSSDVSMVIQSGDTITINANININELTTEVNSRLMMNSERVLSVYGSTLTLANGSMGSANGVIDLLSMDPVSINITGIVALNELVVSTPGGTTLTGTLDIRGTLYLADGDFDASAGTLRLRSNATRTGHLGPVSPTANFIGDLTVERYIPAGATNWRLLGSPVAGRTVADWDDDFITAGFPGSNYPNFDSPVGSGILWPSVRYYDETESGANLNDGLLGVTGMSQELTPGQGFAVWCGNALNGTGAFTIDVKGEPTIARTPFTLPMSFTDNGAAAVDGLNLVSNPLPSAIAFTSIARGADVKNSYQVYDPATGSTALWDGVLGTSVPAGALNGIIQSGQAFWLEAEGPAVTTTVNENSKVSVNEGGLFGGDLEPVIPIVRLTISGTTGNWSDQAAILFQDGLPTLDGGDAVKVDFSHPNAPRIATRTADGHDLILNRFGTYSTSVSIPVTVRVPANGSYTITTGMSGLQGLSCFTLVDLHTGTTTPLSDGAEYSFSMNGTANVVADRFVLQASAPVHYAVSDALCGGTATGAVAVQLTESTDLLTLGDAFGEPVQQATNVAAGEYIFNGLEAGNYTVSILSNTACGTLGGSVLIAQPFELGSTVEVVESTCGTEADGRLEVSVQGGVAPYSYEWNNGSTEAFITGAAGSYYTTVIDAVGCTMFVAHDIPSGSVPEALFESSATTVLVNEPVAFTNHSTTGTDLLWNFGDGTTSTDLNATHSYALPGVYTVVLTANNGICEASVSQDINVQLSTSVTATPASLVLNVWSAADQLVVEYSFDHGHAVLVDVLDATGRLHIQKQFVGTPGRVSIPAASLGTGVWFVRVTSGKVQQTFRVPVLR